MSALRLTELGEVQWSPHVVLGNHLPSLRHKVTCSLLAMSVVSSIMRLQNFAALISSEISRRMSAAIRLSTSFWMLPDVYLSVLFLQASSKLLIISCLQSLQLCFIWLLIVALAASSESLQRGQHLEETAVVFLWSGSCWVNRLSPTLLVVAGKVTAFNTVSGGHLLPSCLSILDVSYFQFHRLASVSALSVLAGNVSLLSALASHNSMPQTHCLSEIAKIQCHNYQMVYNSYLDMFWSLV